MWCIYEHPKTPAMCCAFVSMRLEGCVQYKAGSAFNVCFHKHLAYHTWQVSLPQNKQQNLNTLACEFISCLHTGNALIISSLWTASL